MLRKYIFFISFCLLPLVVCSQNLYVCDGINADGQPINSNHTFSFQNYAAFSVAAFRAVNTADDNYVLVVSKKSEDGFAPQSWMKMNRSSQHSFLTSTINWSSDGDYKLSVMQNGVEKTSDYFTIDVNENDELQNNSGYEGDKYNDPTNTFYFIDSRVWFCKAESEAGNIMNQATSLKAGDVTVVVTSSAKPFTTNSLSVRIYKIVGKDNEQELIEQKEISVMPSDESTHFQYHFTSKGNYSVSVYTIEEVWINDGTIQIK